MLALGLLAGASLVALAWLGPRLRRRGIDRWLPAVAAQSVRRVGRRRPRPTHLFVAVVDHFEPSRGGAPPEVAQARLERWLDRWPALAARHHDADGRTPRHTWCYPYDEWRDGEVAALAGLVYDGFGEVELHLHHDRDTSAGLRATLAAALEAFGRCGALHAAGPAVAQAFAFVHGNWCLDNSRPDGRWCGVNDELTILREAGCYADFTYPAPDGCQPRTVNVIYRATDDPARPRSADRGAPLVAGRPGSGDLVLVPGPLGLNLRDWHHRLYPAIEQAELAAHVPVTPARVDFWIRCGVGVVGRPDWVFVKLHCHGCQERDQEMMLGAGREALCALLEERYNDGRRYLLHYVTAREMYNLAAAAEQGLPGEPAALFDAVIPPPVNRWLRADGPVRAAALSAERGDLENLVDGPVHWTLAVGPVAEVTGRLRRLCWIGEEVTLDGDAKLRPRAEQDA